MDSLPILLTALLLIGMVIFAVRRKIARDDQALAARYAFDEADGIGARGPRYPVRFDGVGPQTTGSFQLEPGRHRLRYRFPAGVQVKVDLFTAAGDETETLVISSGEGERGFSVNGGRYRLDLDPAADDSRWSVALTPLQLPSQRPDSML
jgi:hypothetical protein